MANTRKRSNETQSTGPFTSRRKQKVEPVATTVSQELKPILKKQGSEPTQKEKKSVRFDSSLFNNSESLQKLKKEYDDYFNLFFDDEDDKGARQAIKNRYRQALDEGSDEKTALKSAIKVAKYFVSQEINLATTLEKTFVRKL